MLVALDGLRSLPDTLNAAFNRAYAMISSPPWMSTFAPVM